MSWPAVGDGSKGIQVGSREGDDYEDDIDATAAVCFNKMPDDA